MALDAAIRGVTGTQAGVNADNELAAALTLDEDKAGFVLLASKMGKTSDPGGIYVETIRASDAGRLMTGVDQTAFNDFFPGTAINTGLWSTPVTTMTHTVASGFANLNAGLSLASGAVAQMRSYRHFPTYKSFPTVIQFDIQFVQTPVTGNVCEAGYFLAAGTAAPTDGVFLRINAAGEVRCVVNDNGVETQSAAFSFATYIGAGITVKVMITMNDEETDFYIGDTHVAGIERPTGQAAMTSSMNLPLAFRCYNSSATSVAQVMKVGGVNVTLGDMNTGKLWTHAASGAGAGAIQGQTGATLGQTAVYANSALPGAAVPTNTTAALATGLGGLFLETDTLAVGTDGIVMSYQVPAGTAALPGRSLYITSLDITSAVHTALTGGGYVALWGVAIGSTAVSLATTESATTKAPRRLPIGVGAVAAAGAVGASGGPTLNVRFDVPLFIAPGEFFQVIRRKAVGTAPSAGAILHCINPNGYWE